jgi:DNA helicase-2/ATP-dependent DNA helicase PcrA
VTLPVPSDALSRERINAMAARMGLEIALPEQFAFLESGATLDLQAAPGSGKTTLVALKLAVLAETWSASTRGVCVLSHTTASSP